MRKPVALIILDGVGITDKKENNALYMADTPYLDYLMKEYSHTLVGASGEDVGLPDGQMGNSEVGHLNIGAGRIVYQELTRITKEIKERNLFVNPVLKKAMENAKENHSTLHLMGLLSDGGVHSHIEHLKGLLQMAKENGVKNVAVHCFMDGRDTPPDSGKGYIEELERYMSEISCGRIATISGRYYAMDRDKRWERVEKAYRAVVYADAPHFSSAVEAMEKSYEEGVTDEFILPCVIGEKQFLEEKDSVIFFNFRPDRGRELTRTIVDPEFKNFQRKEILPHFVTMTVYDATMPNVEVAYRPQVLTNTFGEYIAEKGLSQLRIAETEKYAHVTFFFNGGHEVSYEKEDRILVPSPKVATYDLQPEMSAREVTAQLIEDLEQNPKDVIVLNYANGDMVGHTGVLSAAIKAVETVDECLKKVVSKVLEMGGVCLITADHGNCDEMVDENGKPFTAHTTNPVPFIYVDNQNKEAKLAEGGRLCDFAPTMLQLLNLPQPKEMTGRSLILK